MSKPNVLIVDDDEIDRLVARRALKGFIVREAANARAAEEALMHLPADVAVLDFFIPPDTGPEVLARLRKIQPNLPCIFLSGQGNEEVAVEAMKAGAEDYLPKTQVTEPRRLAQLVEHTHETAKLRQQARRAQARLSIALEAAGAGTWSTDPRAKTVTGDARFRELFGLPEGDTWSMEIWRACFTPEDGELLDKSLTSGAVKLQLKVVNVEGRWIELRGRHDDAQGGDFGTVHDISETRAQQEQVLAMKDRLMGIASHDLRNPLSAVKMGATLLARSKSLDEREQRLVSNISVSVERMSKLIVQLLDLTRARLGGGLPLDKKPLDLKQLVETLVEETRLATGRTIDLKVESVVLEADGDRLSQVVSNLLGNAVKHGDSNHPITLTLSPKSKGARLVVENRGEPIPPALLTTLFEPFVQGQTSAVREGLGLGLFISREVVHAHGGTLTATSSPDGLTAFIVEL
ncbi:MAG: ATP-binding protein [Archangium sp.]